MRLFAVLLVLPLLAACESTAEVPSSGGPPVRSGTTGTVDLDGRPFQLHVPGSSDPAAKAPLVVLLHGFTSDAAQIESYFKLTAESQRRGFLLAMPDGTKDREGRRFWNATQACCDFGGLGTDDSGYLSRLIDTVVARYPVDTKRVYFVGHSNGGFMSYRMACEHATKVTAIVSLAGMATADVAACKPQRPVSILQVHGTDDRTVLFEGGGNAGRSYPSVDATLAQWRGHNGCADEADASAAPMDLDSNLAGQETTVTTYRSGCRDATRVELWTIKGGSHGPAFTSNFAPAVTDFLLALSSQ
ncbi:alpha/beta hydrolase family esterase [Allorhizocola rhizosphaerae]|uniref:alpha/beta hydrolase family esterase n=1 Tax=Allorhizocola rhizosphaerae TaxID=1872709 RepID=UPI000E3E6ECB|nr:alpha/beta fold hydrolase [Allorhizocola rhizosphaerae]